MNVDSFQHMVATEGFARWREPSWPESQALTSVVAAHQYRTPIKLLNRYLGRGDSRAILDWGSGSAVFSYALAAEGHRVSAIDLARPPMEEFIQRKTDGRFAFTTASDPVILPFDDETFDVVLSMGCLEHVRETGGNEHRSLVEVQRVMKPGGVFICCHFPNRYSYIEAVARRMSRSSLYAHPFRYTRDDIAALARGTGLSVASVEAYGAIPRNPLSKLPPRLRDSYSFIRAVDWCDDFVASHLGVVCQNLAWVGVKPA